MHLLEYPTLKELRASLEGIAGPALFFVRAGEGELGEDARITLRAEREELEIPLNGMVGWRYPEGCVPPGREAGVGLLLSVESQALPLYRSVIDGVEPLVPPGGRLPELLQLSSELDEGEGRNTESISVSLDSEYPVSSLADDDEFEAERTLSMDELEGLDESEELDPPTELAPPGELDRKHDASFDEPTETDLRRSTTPHSRPLPNNAPWPELPLPLLSARSFLYRNKGVPDQLCAFGWPEDGTQRDTWFGQERDRGRSVDDIFSSHQDEVEDVTDPAKLPEVVSRATSEVAEAETVLALPIALWVTREGAETVLFEAGAALPAETTFRMKAAKTALHIESQVLSERWGEPGRDLVGVVRFPVDEGAPRQVRARATLSPTGLLEVAIPADAPTRTEHLETGIVPVPLSANELGREKSSLLSTLRRLFKAD